MIPSLLNTIKQNGLNSFVSLFIGLTTSSTSPYSEKYAEYKVGVRVRGFLAKAQIAKRQL